MIEYYLSEAQKQVLLDGLDMLIKQTQKEPASCGKGINLSTMFEAKDVLQRCRLTYKD